MPPARTSRRCALACAVLLAPGVSVWAQPGPESRRVVAVSLEIEGRPVSDTALLALVSTTPGEPLDMADVRASIEHLDGLGRFEGVAVDSETAGDGVRLRYRLTPRHPVTGLRVTGETGLPDAEVRRTIVERFGPTPDPARMPEIEAFLGGVYRDAGYPAAVVTASRDVRHDPDRTVLVFAVSAGRAARVRTIRVEGVSGVERAALLERLDLREGLAHDGRGVRAALDRYEQDLRGRGHYEARADASFEYGPDGDVAVTIVADVGPRVTVAFEGDVPPQGQRDELVPVEREASVDEDLLDSAAVRIEEYWKARGYRDAVVTHRREERPGQLTVVFTTARGPRVIVDRVALAGATAVPEADLRAGLGVRAGEPFHQEAVDASVRAVRARYVARGFARAAVAARTELVPGRSGDEVGAAVTLEVDEGPRTLVTRVVIEGTAALPEQAVRAVVTTAPGRPFVDAEVATDLERIELEYRNRGYEEAVARSTVILARGDTEADVHFAVSEGPQVFVDQVVILGYERIARAAIERELQVRPGQPLGAAALLESQRRLAALGLFRRVSISTRAHDTGPQRDVIVQVEEAPALSIDFGGGVGAERRLRPTALGGQAEERLDIAPRGFVQLTRRNLWGKNRTASIFTRVSSLARDTLDSAGRVVTSSYGLHQYRVVGTFREPRVLGTAADLLAVATVDQSVRSSFNFRTRELVGRAALRPDARYGLTATYTFRAVELFNETFSEDERPLIDRLFPQVTLSMIGVSMLRDTRTDPLDPEGGSFLAADQTVAARAYGSAVGFVKSSLEGKLFLRVPTRRRVVVALAGRLGAAHGFERVVEGQVVRDELPASERFFAGGDTTVRGFSLDRLGDAGTITSNGFPKGGNGLVVLNAELRASVTAALQGVVFVDAGNVYPLASDISLTRLRAAAGFGVRYRSPVGPVRVDWGFNLDRRELVSGTLERGYVFHVSLGQAF